MLYSLLYSLFSCFNIPYAVHIRQFEYIRAGCHSSLNSGFLVCRVVPIYMILWYPNKMLYLKNVLPVKIRSFHSEKIRKIAVKTTTGL
ncbi:hypothetical protein T265_08228 [Opisthorchis viverrini]|uniref:Uncharacterized protein n=1 Tax=Opisthorchis viverrini TaxID=6198 RepID=A0A075A920_OPIVI|nr:hypothetical protein T265_08228 [Opisthorchis viverrini]KER24019.1 hypothetical protein T265_08228 [Opisthorchis viverrini]